MSLSWSILTPRRLENEGDVSVLAATECTPRRKRFKDLHSRTQPPYFLDQTLLPRSKSSGPAFFRS